MSATEGGGMTRRELFRRTGTIGAGAAATVTVGSRTVPRFSPIGTAGAIAPAVPIGIVAGGAAIAYFSGDSLPFTGDDRDYSGYTGADALHQEILAGATEMQSADERVMTGIENNIENSENVALAKGKAAVIEEMNKENSESDAQTAMQEAIDGYYATIQENLLTHWKSQIGQIQHHYAQADSHSNLAANDIFGFRTHVYGSDTYENESLIDPSQTQFYHRTSSDLLLQSGEAYFPDHSISLLDGSTVDVPVSQSDSYAVSPAWISAGSTSFDSGSGEPVELAVLNPDSSGRVYYIQPKRYLSAWQQIIDRRDSVNADLSGFASDVYAEYEPGDIPTEDLVDPITAATEMGQDYHDRGFRSAQAAMLGIPTDAEFTAELEIASEDAEDGIWELSADIFTSHVPRATITDSASISSGTLTLTTEPPETTTVTTTDGETVDVPAADFSGGDGEWTADISGSLSTTGTSVETALGGESGFEVGRTYEPSTWDDPFYIAYSYEDEETGDQTSDFTQIESETTVVSATDVNGNEVETFQTESQNNQTADVATLEEELAQIRDAQIQMQTEAEEETSGGGGGGLPSASGALIGIAALIAGYLYIDSN